MGERRGVGRGEAGVVRAAGAVRGVGEVAGAATRRRAGSEGRAGSEPSRLLPQCYLPPPHTKLAPLRSFVYGAELSRRSQVVVQDVIGRPGL